MEGQTNAGGMTDAIPNHLKKEHGAVRQDTFINQQLKDWNILAQIAV